MPRDTAARCGTSAHRRARWPRLHVPRVREHVALEKPAFAPQPLAEPSPQAPRAGELEVDDAVIQEESAWPERSAGRGEILRQGGPSNVLEHPRARDLVEDGPVGQVAVVPELHPAPGAQPVLRDAAGRQLGLSGTEGDPERLHSVAAHRMLDEGTPAAADVQQPLARPEAQLATDVVELGDLGPIEILRFCTRREVGTRVDGLRVKPELVELVAHVVVVSNRRSVAAAIVPACPATRPPPNRRRGRPLARRELAEEACQPDEAAGEVKRSTTMRATGAAASRSPSKSMSSRRNASPNASWEGGSSIARRAPGCRITSVNDSPASAAPGSGNPSQ